MKKIFKIDKNVKKLIFIALLISAIALIYLIFHSNSKIIITEASREIAKSPEEKQMEEDESFKITLKDDKNSVISNAKFIIQEVIFEGEERTYSYPTDELGNVLGEENIIDGESCRVFETDENGTIAVDLKKGLYEVKQISTPNGYLINEENKSWIFGVNESRNNTTIVNIGEKNYTDISGPNKSFAYYLKSREDGCSIYYYNGNVSFIDSNNEIKWTKSINKLSSSSTQINQIEFDESGFTCLFNNGVVKYNDNAEEPKTFIVNDDTFYTAFTIDSDGNYILAGDYNNGNNRDLHLIKLNSNGNQIGDQRINGTGSENEYIYSIIGTDKGYIVSSYIGSNDIKVGETDETIAIPDNWVLMLLDKDTFEIKKWFNTQSNNTTNDFRKVHSVRKGQNGEIYYAGVFSGTINFSGENTVSGQTITLDGQGVRDSFVLKLTDDLKIEWATSIVGPGEDSFYEFEITRDNGIFLVGETNSGNIQLEGEKTQSGYTIKTEPVPEYTGTWRGIAAKVDSEGKVVWVKEFGLTNDESFYGGVALGDNTYLIAARETVSGSEKASYIRISEEEQDTSIAQVSSLEVVNERETYKIKTSVKGEGGTISGIDDEVFKIVKYGDDCLNEIVMTPNKHYEIVSIKVNGEEYPFEVNEDDTYILQLENITEDKQVEVTYELKSYGYRIEYYYDGQLDEEKTENKIAIYGSKINEYPDKRIAGYKFDKTENLPLTISENSANNVIKVYYIEKEAFNINVKDDRNSVISNAKFIIKEVIFEGEERTYSDPTDESGNVLGTEENIDGENYRVFTTNEDGNISVKLKDGIYEIEQIATSDGHIIDENNKIWTIGVNDTRENTITINAEEPIYTGINSSPLPFHHVVQGREDGSSVYYNNDNLSFINADNTIEWTKSISELEGSSGVIRQIEFDENKIDCLYRRRIGRYNDNAIKLDGHDRMAENNTAYESFTIDSDGNYIWFGDYGDGDNRLLIDKFDSDFNKIEDGSEYGAGEGAIYGTGDEYAYTIIDTDEGYLITAYVGSQEITDKTGKTTTIGDSEYVILLIDKQTLEVKDYLDTKADSGYDDDEHKIHNLIKGKNGEIYYAGIFTGTINFSGENTASGTPIELTSKGGSDGFVMKITKDLKIEWAISVGGEGNDNFYNADLTTDNGIILAGGSDRGHIQETGKNTASGYEINTTPISENAGSNIGIAAKVNAEGKLVWANEFGYTSNETFLDVATLNNNNYILVGNENDGSGGKASYVRISEEEQDTSIAQVSSLEVVNERETYEIKTSVNGEGGTISGSDDEVFENVKYGDDCLKEIVMTPNKHYEIVSIKVNGEEYPFEANEDDTYILQLKNITENIKVEVTYGLKQYSYKIIYYKNAQIEEERIITTVITGSDDYIPINKSEIAPLNKYIGYRLNLDSIIPDRVKPNDVIRVYYIKNPTYINLSYTVEYYQGEVKVEQKVVQILTQLQTDIYVDRATIAPANKYEGYKLDNTKVIPSLVKNGGIVQVYYIADTIEPKNVSYKIEYYKDEIKVDEQIVETEIQELEENIVINTEEVAPLNKYKGYKINKIELDNEIVESLPNEVKPETVIKVYYVIDEEQQKDVSYIVEYYKDEIKVDQQIIQAQIQVLEQKIIVDKDKIAPANKYEGYKLDDTKEIPDSAIDREIIRIYYVSEKIESNIADYKIEYYYDNILDNRKTENIEATVGEIISKDMIAENIEANIVEGYKLEKILNIPLVISENQDENIIEVYFIKEDNNDNKNNDDNENNNKNEDNENGNNNNDVNDNKDDENDNNNNDVNDNKDNENDNNNNDVNNNKDNENSNNNNELNNNSNSDSKNDNSVDKTTENNNKIDDTNSNNVKNNTNNYNNNAGNNNLNSISNSYENNLGINMIPDTGDVLPILVGIVILLVVALNISIIVVRKNRNTYKLEK